MVEWDERKREANLGKHKVDFALVEEFEWETAFVVGDTRHAYGEIRLQALGLINDRLHMLVCTIAENRRDLRVISLRKANRKEMERYVNES